MVHQPFAIVTLAFYSFNDVLQGYGRILLSNVISAPLSATFDLFVDDNRELVSNETLVYLVTVTAPSQPLR